MGLCNLRSTSLEQKTGEKDFSMKLDDQWLYHKHKQGCRGNAGTAVSVVQWSDRSGFGSDRHIGCRKGQSTSVLYFLFVTPTSKVKVTEYLDNYVRLGFKQGSYQLISQNRL